MLVRPLRSALRWAMAMASALMSAAVTRAAPPLAAFSAKLPVWVKQSSTVWPAAMPCHGPAVVLLVEEEAGLLAVLKINVVEHAVLADLGLGAGGVGLAGQVEPALVLLPGPSLARRASSFRS